jgi:hypothetical protein
LEFCLAIPGTRAPIASALYLTNAIWTNKKILIEIIEAAIVTKRHFRILSCNDFGNMVAYSPKLHKEICLSTKNKTFVQEQQATRLTLTAKSTENKLLCFLKNL